MKTLPQYSFAKSLRPFSLVVALVGAGLGVVLGWHSATDTPWLALLIIAGAVLAQAGVNLINDIEDLQMLGADTASLIRRRLIYRNALFGVVCFIAATLIAAWLIWLRGWVLFYIILASAILALNYNIGPLNFKQRGLAMLQVFVLMGLVLVQGAYIAMSGEISLLVAKLSLPVSVLVSLLLLSNELRDWQSDHDHGIKTLSVRIGYKNGVKLYWLLIAFAYAAAMLFYFQGDIQQVWWLLLPLPLLIPINRYLRSDIRTGLTPMTGRFFFLFGVAYILAL